MLMSLELTLVALALLNPSDVIQHRLDWNDPSLLQTEVFDADRPGLQWWSDGLVYWQDVFWLNC